MKRMPAGGKEGPRRETRGDAGVCADVLSPVPEGRACSIDSGGMSERFGNRLSRLSLLSPGPALDPPPSCGGYDLRPAEGRPGSGQLIAGGTAAALRAALALRCRDSSI